MLYYTFIDMRNKRPCKKEIGMNIKKIICMLCFVIFIFNFSGCNGGKNTDTEQKFDATKLPYYEREYASLTDSYTNEQRIRPFWQGNVIYNEQLMVVKKDGKTEGHLLYDALRIISVKDAALKKEFAEGVDYTVSGNTITLPEGSSIPVFCDEWASGENVPKEYPQGNAASGYQMIGGAIYTETSLIWGNYIHVTYVYDAEKVDRTVLKTYNEELYGLSRKLLDKQDIRMVVYGDSISEGCSSSAQWNHEPQCPPYAELVKEGIEYYGGVSVTMKNLSVGGKDSVWAAEDGQIGTLVEEKPDLLILAFGTNDSYINVESGVYRKNLGKIISAVKAVNSECQIILIAPFPSNEKTKQYQAQDIVCTALTELAEEDAEKENWMDICLVDMYHNVRKMLEVKNYYEIAANNINHPNDFIHRFYAMNILSAIFDFSKKI